MSFQNRRVRIWFAFILPLSILAVLLYIFLPNELQFIPTLILIAGLVIYYAWILIDKRKRRLS